MLEVAMNFFMASIQISCGSVESTPKSATGNLKTFENLAVFSLSISHLKAP